MKVQNNDEATAPVIGVILMVAVTVILAAVIGVYVFGMPQASGEVWFRITLLHDEIANILNYLWLIEKVLLKNEGELDKAGENMLIKEANVIYDNIYIEESKQKLQNLNKQVRDLIAVSTEEKDFSKAGYCGTREGHFDGQAIDDDQEIPYR